MGALVWIRNPPGRLGAEGEVCWPEPPTGAALTQLLNFYKTALVNKYGSSTANASGWFAQTYVWDTAGAKWNYVNSKSDVTEKAWTTYSDAAIAIGHTLLRWHMPFSAAPSRSGAQHCVPAPGNGSDDGGPKEEGCWPTPKFVRLKVPTDQGIMWATQFYEANEDGEWRVTGNNAWGEHPNIAERDAKDFVAEGERRAAYVYDYNVARKDGVVRPQGGYASSDMKLSDCGEPGETSPPGKGDPGDDSEFQEGGTGGGTTSKGSMGPLLVVAAFAAVAVYVALR